MDKLSSLWQGASYQDSLLQSYRNFHLTLQSILFAIGAGLCVASLTFETQLKIIFSYILLLLITLLGIYLLRKMRSLIKTTGEDVDYFHTAISEFEKNLSKEDKTLTAFKYYQKEIKNKKNKGEDFLNVDLTDEKRINLILKDEKDARQLLGKYLFRWLYFIWFWFHAVSLYAVIQSFNIKNCT